jgi:pimeloyl-ACP methyl ester carboxylesterase
VNEERIGDLTALHAAPAGPARTYPMVLVHGLWAGAWIFQDWLGPAAERGWDVWAPNLRGRAGSRPMDELGSVGLADLAGDLGDILNEVGPAVVVGYSMGGLLTQIVAADPRTRHLVRAAALMCSVPPRGIVALSGPVLRASAAYLGPMLRSTTFMPSRAHANAMMMNGIPVEDRDRWFPRFIADSGRAARQIATGAAKVDPEAITCPVLVVSCEHDRISPPSIQPALVKRYGAAHLPVAGHAHLVAIEPGWEAVEAAILDRLEPFSTATPIVTR